MIKAVFFDFYNTLVRFWPPLDQIQHAACREFGFNISPEAISYGYSVADLYFNRQNEFKTLSERTEEERLDFFAHYEQILLDNAGLSVSLDLARQIWEIAISVPKEFIPFDDATRSLQMLKERGYCVGVISNLRRNMDQLCDNLGIAPYLDFCVTSAEVGVEKPDPAIFREALERAGVGAGEAVHVGDQPRSDLVGAREAGLYAVLLDRGNWHGDVRDCVRINALSELEGLLAGAPESLQVAARGPAHPDYIVDEQAAE